LDLENGILASVTILGAALVKVGLLEIVDDCVRSNEMDCVVDDLVVILADEESIVSIELIDEVSSADTEAKPVGKEGVVIVGSVLVVVGRASGSEVLDKT
jgi:hypothetical protein